MNFLFFALAAAGSGISGGDKIFIEFARRWQKQAKITIFVNEEGREMCRRQNLSENKNLEYEVWSTARWRKFGFVVTYLIRIFRSVFEAFKLTIDNQSLIILYSASEFWMDSLPAFILKLRYPKVRWVAAWYQTAPNPFLGYSEGEREKSYRIDSFLYWLMQLPIKPVISLFADYVLVNNKEERKQFPDLARRGKVIVVLGAVDLDKIKKWRLKNGKLSKLYDSVFQGRFHPQKGVVELVDIWRKVVDKKPDAKLAMVGDGPLMKDVKLKIKNLKLENHIKLFGYLFDGPEKYKVFSQSKIVVHPAFYDSGGMAAAEAMAFGLPAVGFDLPSFKSYYPEGMVKIKIGDLKAFSKEILNYLSDDSKREKDGGKAKDFIERKWSWDDRAQEVSTHIRK